MAFYKFARFEVNYGQEETGIIQETSGDAPAGSAPHGEPDSGGRPLRRRRYGAGYRRSRRELLHERISVQPEQQRAPVATDGGSGAGPDSRRQFRRVLA